MRRTYLQWIFIRCHQSFVVSPSFDQRESADFARCVRQCENYILKSDSTKNAVQKDLQNQLEYGIISPGMWLSRWRHKQFAVFPRPKPSIPYSKSPDESNWFFVCFASSAVASNLCTVAVRPVSPFVTNCCSLSSSFTVTASNYFSTIDFYSHIFLFQRFVLLLLLLGFVWSVFALRSDKIVVFFCKSMRKWERKRWKEMKWNEWRNTLAVGGEGRNPFVLII